ncbi:MAG: hypothetical protein AAGA56_26410 [Myxococcota bacterium]
MNVRKHTLRHIVGSTVGLLFFFGSSVAFAQAGAGPDVTETGGGDDGGYGYEFADDPLTAGGFGPNDATIKVRPGPIRRMLIRPRTSFVPEMRKSVENI